MQTVKSDTIFRHFHNILHFINPLVTVNFCNEIHTLISSLQPLPMKQSIINSTQTTTYVPQCIAYLPHFEVECGKITTNFR